jgi:hypothetical protein
MEVSITPDHMGQRHWFQFEIDHSYLPPLGAASLFLGRVLDGLMSREFLPSLV